MADPNNPALPANADFVFEAAAELRALKQQLLVNLELANTYSASLFGLTQSEIDAALIDINSVYTKAQIDGMFNVLDAATLGGETKEQLVAEVDNEVTRLAFPKGGAYRGSTAGAQLGAIKIKLPQTWTNTQVKFTVSIYRGTTGESIDLNISGYTDATTQAWTTVTARWSGIYTKTSFPKVRFGNDTVNCVVYIGELADSWTNLNLVITNVQVSKDNIELTKWDAGWAIGMELVGFVGVDAEVTDNRVVIDINPTANTLPKRTADGDMSARLFRSSFATQTVTPPIDAEVMIRKSVTNDYLRPISRTAFLKYLTTIGCPGQTWTAVTRIKGVTYTNTTNGTIAVNAWLARNSNNGLMLWVNISGVVLSLGDGSGSAYAGTAGGTFLVPTGGTYRIYSSGGTSGALSCRELR